MHRNPVLQRTMLTKYKVIFAACKFLNFSIKMPRFYFQGHLCSQISVRSKKDECYINISKDQIFAS